MKLKALVIVAVWLFWGSFSSAQAQAKPCGCADKEDLINRLNIVEAAIQEYVAQIEVMKAQEIKDGKHLMTTQERYDILQKSVNTVMERVKNPSAKVATAKSSGSACDFEELNSPTDCLREAITRHEKVHHSACLATKDSRALWETYQTQMRLADFAQEEIYAYREERKFILSQLQSLPKLCRPNNWFGYVVYQRVGTSANVDPVPPRPRSGPYGAFHGGNRTIGEVWTEIGTTLVEEGKALSIRTYAAYSQDSSSNDSQDVLCDAIVGFKPRVNSSGHKIFADGEADGDIVSASKFTLLAVHAADQTYDLDVRIFPVVKMTGQKALWSKSTGGCRKDQESNTTEPFTSSTRVVGHYVTNEKIKPGSSDYLEGSRVVKPPEFNKSSKSGNISTTLTQEIQFRWMLRRLPAK